MAVYNDFKTLNDKTFRVQVGPPCKDCPDKSIGCHPKCIKYTAWSLFNDETRQKVRKAKHLRSYN